MPNELRAPGIGQQRTFTPGQAPDETFQRFSQGLGMLEKFAQQTAGYANDTNLRVSKLENTIGSLVNGTINTWTDLVPAATVEVNPSTSSRQMLAVDQVTSITLVSGYAGDDSVMLVIRQGATPFAVTFDAAWNLNSTFAPPVEANTYSTYQFEFKGGVPYLKGLPILSVS